MTVGFNNLKHLVVLMMENRSFDHMLGGLSLVMENGQKKYPGVNGLTGNESNPDTNGNPVKVNPNAKFQSQLDPDPDHHFPGVDMQIFNGAQQGPGRVRSMRSRAEEARLRHRLGQLGLSGEAPAQPSVRDHPVTTEGMGPNSRGLASHPEMGSTTNSNRTGESTL